MKKFLLIFSVLLTILSCDSDPKGYVIDAKIDGVEDGKIVTLRTIKNNKPVMVDTTRVKNGSFTFNGSLNIPDFHMLFIENEKGSLPFILENKELKITLYKDSLELSKIEGSPENDVAHKFMQGVKQFKLKNDALNQELRNAQMNKDTVFLKTFNQKRTELRNENNEFNIEYIKENNESLFAAFLLENLIQSRAIKIPEANEIFKAFPERLKGSAPGLRVKEKIDATLATEEGAVAPDFTAPSPEGKEITLSKIRGKVTIVDFWAAWCGPCRKENPNIVKVYEKYHDKGLEIIGVSLDGNPRQKDARQEWLNAIEKDGLKWHHVSNLNYFNDPVAKKYNIRSIPATFILDSEGKIVAKNLRGPALERKISELLD